MRPYDYAVAALGLLLLSACGGGNAGGSSSAATNNSPSAATYTVGGTASGLGSTGLVLLLNSSASLTVGANGGFTFSSVGLSTGAAYAVTVGTQPSSPAQTCTVANGGGTMGSANVVNVSVACTTNTYTIGGTVSGLAGTGLVLRNNGGSDLTINTNGAFVFGANVASSGTYTVAVSIQPARPAQTCTVSNGNGTVTSANVTNIAVACGRDTAAGVIGTGFMTTCVLTGAGGVKCWGYGTFGQLGDGANRDSSIPVDVAGLTSGVAAVSVGTGGAGGSSCAITVAGGLKCWGANSQDGNNYTAIPTPQNVGGLTSGVASVSVGSLHTCAVTTAGGVKCWGKNSNGQLGNGTNTDSLIPVSVSGLAGGVASVSAGFDHTCAVMTTGGVKCWGDNYSGGLGNGTTTDSWTPVDVATLTSGVASVSSGTLYTCAVTTAGGVKCWGTNASHELGNGTQINSSIPVNATGLTSGVASISAGAYHVCAVTTAGAAECWGTNYSGSLGTGATTIDGGSTPVTVIGLTGGVAAISAGGSVGSLGDEHTCAMMTTGRVKCWGNNALGQLGTGTTISSPTPVDVIGF